MQSSRRNALRAWGAAGAFAALAPALAGAQPKPILTRPIPSTGERCRSSASARWITFNVGNDPVARDTCAEVMRAFVEARRPDDRLVADVRLVAGRHRLRRCARRRSRGRVFSADKVWISSGARGREQIEQSRRRWHVARFDLVQVHNLLTWQEHLPTLFAMKAAGQIRYVGITTSEGRRHRDIEQVMRTHPIDFVQVTYNPARPRGRGAHPAARARSRHRGDRQPAVPRRRAAARAGTAAACRRGPRRSTARAGPSSC